VIQVVVQAPVPPVAPIPPIPEVLILPPWMTLPAPAVALVSIAFIAGVALVLFPIARAIARRLEGRGGNAELLQQVDDLRERLRELEAVQHRVAELEEHLDFAERLLARPQETERAGG
jgi:hypothetical protein